jgi:hypothetical protein
MGLKARPILDRLMERVVQQPNGCWWFTGTLNPMGYGMISTRTRRSSLLAHRVTYEAFVGPIPAGLELDHQCHNKDESCAGGSGCLHRRCCNPAHLEPVTRSQNNKRGRLGRAIRTRSAAITECPQGHGYTPENTRFTKVGTRSCRTCDRARSLAHYYSDLERHRTEARLRAREARRRNATK